MLSASHLIILFLVALLVFGPEKLPELARTLSKTMMEFRRITGEFQDTLQREMKQLEREALEHSRPRPAPPLAMPPALPLEIQAAAESSADANSTPEITEPDAATVKGASGEWAAASPEAELAEPHSSSPMEDLAEEKTPVTPTAEKPANGHPTAA